MRQFARIALASSLLLSTVACAQPVATPVASTPAVTTAATASKAHASGATVAAAIAGATNPMVKDLGHADGAAVAVTVKAPADRAILALQHRWLAKDVTSYEVTLLSADADGAYTTEVATLSIAAATYTSTTAYKALAAFTGLEANKKYKVTVEAWGSNASTPATEPNQQLNMQTASEAFFDFMENTNGDIETAPPAQDVLVVLDSFEFSGSAGINAKVQEGAFKPAAGGVQAKAAPQPKISGADWFSAWGYDIVSVHFSGLDMTTKVQGNDGNWYTPTGVEAVALDGNYYGPQHANYNGMAAPNGEGRLQWWYWAGTWSGTGTTKVGVRAVYNGDGVYGHGPIQAENTGGIPQWWL